MSINPSFDAAAAQYDDTFTHTFTGRGQRNLVWKWLDRIIEKHPNKKYKILEINCGTGEDAIYLAQKGHQVLATDISPKMIEIAQLKSSKQNLSNLSFRTLDANNLEQLDGPFDMVFSNFGGLNCLSPQQLTALSAKVARLLTPQGIFIGVIMSRKCSWERLYYFAKGNKQQRQRRMQNAPLEIIVDGSVVTTWFYSPKECKECFGKSLQFVMVKPIGIGYPPSYLNSFVEKHTGLKGIVLMIEGLLGNTSFLANHSDHFLITFTKA
jgi:ubiquinone/menaquinone biosynthesis C-methylase UbiE